ncbi:polyprenyl synthetase family protein [Mycobacterium sp. ITM-2016-00316]|uniref:polyprenyl synthetase family protein n=1 Tax=Mycobacterium sp. ITM-2016-00316 TaxID=2099695 RepID=UPI000CF93747|nr:polyprenyl synthetase family protein [Mycobacterium sp. ITM-2016-00316]WNG79606.1 polyprenyl synthetase family protein [Mycobacterium sp. ITM-2016-00316]
MPDKPEITDFLVAVEQRLHTCVTATVAEPLQQIDTALSAFAQIGLSSVTAGGKRLRPRFAFCAWRLGAKDLSATGPVVQLAAALELLHAAILVHDDIIDRSELRRGRPSARAALADHHRTQRWWGAAQEFGDATALLVGDLLWAAAHDEFDDATAALLPNQRRAITQCFRTMRVEVLSGQLLELRAQAERDHSPGAAEKILRYKTGSYTVVRPVELGSILAGHAPTLVAKALSSYSGAVGQAFQLRDDLADLFSSAESTGKRPGDDIRTGKPTELLGATITMSAEADARILNRIVGNEAADQDDIAEVQQIALRSGAVRRTRQRISELVAVADRALTDLPEELDHAGVYGLAGLLAECTDLRFLADA